MASRDFNPFDLFQHLERDLLNTSTAPMRGVIFHPRMDMYETAENLVVKVELAGIKPDQLSIELSADDRTLSVVGDRIEPQDDHLDRLRCFQLEVFYGTFERTIVLPGDVRIKRDEIRASYRDGFLLITLPKSLEEKTERRTITVTHE